MKWFLRVLFTLLLVGGWLGLGYLFMTFYLESPKRSGVTQLVIPSNSTLSEIGVLLKKNNLIRDDWPFRYYAWYKGKTNLKPGFYEIAPNENLNSIMERIHGGQQDTVKVTVPEGSHIGEIADILGKAGLDKEAFLKEVNERTPTYEFEKEIPDDPNRKYRLEGYLFPSTYEFKKGEAADKIVKAMLDQFAERMNDLKVREKLKERDMSVHEWVTFASVIEKEGQARSELPQIAGVIYNRLHKNMKLQVDATVIYLYAMRGEQKKRLYFKDLEIPSPYNTYKNEGLPPSPIAGPGIASLEAVVNPNQHDFLFYVTKKMVLENITLQKHCKNIINLLSVVKKI